MELLEQQWDRSLRAQYTELLLNYLRQAAGRGLHCSIAGAGGAAHLHTLLVQVKQPPRLDYDTWITKLCFELDMSVNFHPSS